MAKKAVIVKFHGGNVVVETYERQFLAIITDDGEDIIIENADSLDEKTTDALRSVIAAAFRLV